jgi:hypothetical protein
MAEEERLLRGLDEPHSLLCNQIGKVTPCVHLMAVSVEVVRSGGVRVSNIIDRPTKRTEKLVEAMAVRVKPRLSTQVPLPEQSSRIAHAFQ